MPSQYALIRLASLLILLTSAARAEDRPAAVSPKLERVSAALRPFVERGEVTGAVSLVAHRERIIHLEAVGSADMKAGSHLREDALFWIASMTKPVVGVAVLMLQDEGKLSVDDPVSKHIPEFAQLRGPGGEEARVTISQCLTHTSGMAEASAEESLPARNLGEVVLAAVRKPLVFLPDSRWQYCQSGINTAARVVEVVSGKTFPEFLEERLFGPLGMKDTTFYPTAEQVRRLAKSYRTKSGTPEETPIFILQGKDILSRERYPAANGGLFSTATDYARFCQMLLAGGSWQGRRYLKPETVKLMTTIQTRDLVTGFTPGNGWGLGCCVVRDPQGVTGALSRGSFGHGGAYGTQSWIDPVKGAIYILMVQRADFPNSDASDLRRAFQDAAAPALPVVE